MHSSCRSIVSILLLLMIMLFPSDAAAQRRALCVHGLEPGQTLGARSGPGREHPVVARFPAKACNVRLVGPCDGAWCQMALGPAGGWVDTRFIGVYELPGSRVADALELSNSPRQIAHPPTSAGACVSRVAPWDTLRIRTGPGTDRDEIGEIPASACGVGLIGGCYGRWCRIAWRGRAGWVNTYYLD